MQKRAISGGQVGINGEWYNGGEFLPNTSLPKQIKEERTPKVRKLEIEPYVWVEVSGNMFSLYGFLAGVWGKVISGKMVMVANETTFQYFRADREKVQALIDRYNNGERLMEQNPAITH